MRRLAALAGLAALAPALTAQQPAAPPAPPPPVPLAVGTEAPDFTLPSATKEGLGKPVHLKDLRGQTVVIAFFYKARTKG